MLLGDWSDLSPEEADAIEGDHHAWCVQLKLDGVRAPLHSGTGGIRVTGRMRVRDALESLRQQVGPPGVIVSALPRKHPPSGTSPAVVADGAK
jgi:hypothetical protein